MTILPDWNSIESTARWSDILFGAGIVCLVLLAVTEVASHVYGNRSAYLRDEAARADQKRAEEKLAAAEKIAAEAREAANKAQKQIEGRRLTSTQKQALIAALKPFAGQKCYISFMHGNAEAEVYANDFIEVLEAAGWDHFGDRGIIQSTWRDAIFGIQLTVHEPSKGVGVVTPGIAALLKAAKELGLTEGPEFYRVSEVPSGVVDVRIGAKK